MRGVCSHAWKNDKTAALEDCKKVIPINSKNPLVYQTQGDILKLFKNHDEVLVSFRTYKERESNGIEKVLEEYRAELR